MKPSEQSTSIWQATSAEVRGQGLQGDLQADVCVVGAGIAGVTTAYLLARAGKSVVVLDDGPLGGGETCRTTAHLATALDKRYSELEILHGLSGARLAAASHRAAIERIAAIVATENLACDFARLDGYLMPARGESAEVLTKEIEAAHRAGLTDVQQLDRTPGRLVSEGPCLRFPHQAQFHPLKYLYGLARATEASGGKIFTRSHASAIEGGTPCRVRTAAGPVVTARDVVVATNSPVNDWVSMHTKQAAYRSYVIGARVQPGSVGKALYWDTADPFHYVRLQEVGDAELLIVGGEDHKTGQEGNTTERFSRLEWWMRDVYPMAAEIEFQWSGQVIESLDGLAYIGRNSHAEPHVFIATGDSGNGMTHGTIAGILLTDLIAGRSNEWTNLYDPSRIPVNAAVEFTKENLNVAGQYLDYITPGDRDSTDEIQRGEGAVVRKGLTKVAAFRDAEGVLHERSAVCPHLGCIVHWNHTELTWDCPCHGSRFRISGEVINGPALTGLSKAE